MKQKTVTGILVVMVLGAGAMWGLWYGGGSGGEAVAPVKKPEWMREGNKLEIPPSISSPYRRNERKVGNPTQEEAQRETDVDHSQELSELLESVKNLPEGPERSSLRKKILELAFRARNDELGARAYTSLLEEKIKAREFSVYLVFATASSYERSGKSDSAIEFLEQAIAAIEEDKLDLGSYRGVRVTTDKQRACIVKEIEDEIEDIRRASKPPEKGTQKVSFDQVPALGIFCEPPDLTLVQKARYAEAKLANDAGNYAKAESVLASLGDTEGAAAVLAMQARMARKASAFDAVISKYPNTSQAELALYYQALEYKNEKNAVASRTILNEYLTKYPEGLRKLDVLLALAQDAEQEGRVDEELKYVEKAQEFYRSRKGVQIMVVMHLRELYRTNGDTESLKRLLESSVEELEDSNYQALGLEGAVSDFERVSFAEMFRKELAELKQREEAAAQGKK